MQVDRAVVRPSRTRAPPRRSRAARPIGDVDDRERVGRGGAQRHARRRVVLGLAQHEAAARARRSSPARLERLGVRAPARAERRRRRRRSAAPRARRTAGARGGSARSRGRGSPPRPAGRGTRRDGGRRTGRARPRRRRRPRARGRAGPRGPTSAAATRPCPGNVTTTAASSAPMSMPSSSASVVMTAQQLAADQPRLELAPLLRRVAGAVRRDRVGRAPALGAAGRATSFAVSSTALRDLMKQIVRAPSRTSSTSRSAASASALRRAPQRLVDERRVPHRDLPPRAAASRRARRA